MSLSKLTGCIVAEYLEANFNWAYLVLSWQSQHEVQTTGGGSPEQSALMSRVSSPLKSATDLVLAFAEGPPTVHMKSISPAN